MFRRINDEHPVVVTFFAQHHHDGGDAGAEEDVRWQSDDGLNMVVFH